MYMRRCGRSHQNYKIIIIKKILCVVHSIKLSHEWFQNKLLFISFLIYGIFHSPWVHQTYPINRVEKSGKRIIWASIGTRIVLEKICIFKKKFHPLDRHFEENSKEIMLFTQLVSLPVQIIFFDRFNNTVHWIVELWNMP